MSEIILNQDMEVARLVSKLIPGIKSEEDLGTYRAVGFSKDGQLVAGAIFTNYTGFDVTISLASKVKGWATKQTFPYIATLVFEKWHCRRLTAIIAKQNKHAREFSEKIGFKLEGVKRKGYRDNDDAMIYGMLKSECRWL